MGGGTDCVLNSLLIVHLTLFYKLCSSIMLKAESYVLLILIIRTCGLLITLNGKMKICFLSFLVNFHMIL